jgi:hypothetical protein
LESEWDINPAILSAVWFMIRHIFVSSSSFPYFCFSSFFTQFKNEAFSTEAGVYIKYYYHLLFRIISFSP